MVRAEHLDTKLEGYTPMRTLTLAAILAASVVSTSAMAGGIGTVEKRAPGVRAAGIIAEKKLLTDRKLIDDKELLERRLAERRLAEILRLRLIDARR